MSETNAQPREADALARIVPMAMLPEAFASMVQRMSASTVDERNAAAAAVAPRRLRRDTSAVAVLSVDGAISARPSWLSAMFGGATVTDIRAQLADALADDSVHAIALDINSPGGYTDLIPELAADIRAARGNGKPIVAVANTMAASAAYWLAAQADELVVTPSGEVGSVGVFAAHIDTSKMAEQAGVKVSLIHAGKYKVETNPHEPLGDEARAHIQSVVDEFYGMFVSDVAKGRRVSVETVRSDFGQGRLVTAKAAVRAGMADSVATLEQTVARLARRPREQAAPSASVSASGMNDGGGFTPWPTATASTANTPPATFSDAVSDALRAIDTVVSGSEALRVLTGSKREQLEALRERIDAMLAQAGETATDDGDALELAFADASTRLEYGTV